jgi:hypothetical protein
MVLNISRITRESCLSVGKFIRSQELYHGWALMTAKAKRFGPDVTWPGRSIRA